MAKGIGIMAKRKGLSTSFDSPSESARSKRTDQQNRARRKRLHTDNDPEGPPDRKRAFNSGDHTPTGHKKTRHSFKLADSSNKRLVLRRWGKVYYI